MDVAYFDLERRMFRMGECAIAHGIIKAAMIRSPLVRRTASWQLLFWEWYL
ncbi:MAG TPA: hypothetical protein IAA67_01365 [Candidatus Avoscillospira stercorigallinarum]|uniref:Uncharacterized protein n=1 Tax=Candidatus Avoscillospira stercorigallinarum TaxID=2840708 RepID=A0A9D0Z6X6_9FIRM|nr:hypothetical protein [Candidatus Avoscillospira stercorigallinarum]